MRLVELMGGRMWIASEAGKGQHLPFFGALRTGAMQQSRISYPPQREVTAASKIVDERYALLRFSRNFGNAATNALAAAATNSGMRVRKLNDRNARNPILESDFPKPGPDLACGAR